jgi:hypothetical protein
MSSPSIGSEHFADPMQFQLPADRKCVDRRALRCPVNARHQVQAVFYNSHDRLGWFLRRNELERVFDLLPGLARQDSFRHNSST